MHGRGEKAWRGCSCVMAWASIGTDRVQGIDIKLRFPNLGETRWLQGHDEDGDEEDGGWKRVVGGQGLILGRLSKFA